MSWYKDPAEKYGGAFVTTRPQQDDDARNLSAVAGPSPVKSMSPVSPHSPLFWFGVIAAASVGLMAYSTSVRVGPVSAAVAVGKK